MVISFLLYQILKNTNVFEHMVLHQFLQPCFPLVELTSNFLVS